MALIILNRGADKAMQSSSERTTSFGFLSIISVQKKMNSGCIKPLVKYFVNTNLEINLFKG